MGAEAEDRRGFVGGLEDVIVAVGPGPVKLHVSLVETTSAGMRRGGGQVKMCYVGSRWVRGSGGGHLGCDQGELFGGGVVAVIGASRDVCRVHAVHCIQKKSHRPSPDRRSGEQYFGIWLTVKFELSLVLQFCKVLLH